MTEDFLFHKVSETEKEKIKKEAKSIMDSFSKKLSSIDKKLVKENLIEREDGEREEGKGKKLPLNRDLFFENAPNKDKDKGTIIAERKGW